MQWSDIVWKGCSPANFTEGRGGKTIRFITFHHAVGSMESVASAWANPARQASSHFTVGERGAWQFVDTDDTAWCNGNYASNQECIILVILTLAVLKSQHSLLPYFVRHTQLLLAGTSTTKYR